jgi:hypothetical protein
LNKRIYGVWEKQSPDDPKVMHEAIEEHSKWEIGFNAVCEKYSIPKPTFQ